MVKFLAGEVTILALLLEEFTWYLDPVINITLLCLVCNHKTLYFFDFFAELSQKIVYFSIEKNAFVLVNQNGHCCKPMIKRLCT